MRIALSTNVIASKGLLRDAEILKVILKGMGHEVLIWQFDDNTEGERVDLLIFLEVLNPTFFKWAGRSILIPNPEWFRPQLAYLIPRLELVLCKTQDAVRLFTPIAKQVYYTGFTADDMYDPSVPRLPVFLHNNGQSQAKNTQAIIDAWMMFNLPHPLIIVGDHYEVGWHRNIRVLKNIPKPELVRLKNECRFHIMASAYEGYGQSYWESASCGAVLISGDWAPLNETTVVARSLRMQPTVTGKQGIATTHGVNPMQVFNAVDQCLRFTPDDWDMIGNRARESYLSERTAFEGRFKRLISHVGGLGYKEPLLVKNLVDTVS